MVKKKKNEKNKEIENWGEIQKVRREKREEGQIYKLWQNIIMIQFLWVKWCTVLKKIKEYLRSFQKS